WTLERDSSAAAGGKGPSAPRAAAAPLWHQPVPATLIWRTGLRQLTVYPLDPLGQRRPALPEAAVRKTAGGFEIALQRNAAESALWFEAEARP
ncbi:MAG: hypothetical protein WA086_17325, partial [Ideonella sp.]